MNGLVSMLGGAWRDIATEYTWAKWTGTLLDTLEQIMWVALALVGAAGAIYAIYVGVKMARADSAEGREENKKRLINIIVSIIVVIVLILAFNIFVPMILKAVLGEPPAQGGSGATALRLLLHI